MDAFELLKADHKKVAELFDSLEAASGKAKLVVFKQIKSELDLHAHIEEKFLYPALEKPEETHDLTLEAYEEHKVVKTLLAELAAASTADDEWQAKAKVLRENVEHHVKEEENELFDKADDVLSDEEIEDLGNRMETEKARRQDGPAPKKTAPKSKASKEEPGILSKIADFVGLGSGTAEKRAGARKSPTKKTSARKAAKAGSKKASKKSGGKSAGAAPIKRSAKGKGAKGVAASRSGSSSTKKSGSGSAKKARKK